ncbi:hypothetical protein GCM10027430_32050 [Lysobacter tyrosinilyticus]
MPSFSMATMVALAATFAGAACIALLIIFWSALLPDAIAVIATLIAATNAASAQIDLDIARLLSGWRLPREHCGAIPHAASHPLNGGVHGAVC